MILVKLLYFSFLFFKLRPPDTEQLVEQAIQDICAGGMSIPGVESGYIALWAVNFAGQVCVYKYEEEYCNVVCDF